MGRETDDEREARLKAGGAWLAEQIESRRHPDGSKWTQRYLAEQLGVSQQQVSLYVRGRFEIDGKLARDLARVLDLPQRDVWRGMRLQLPEEFETDDAIVAWARRVAPRSMAIAMGEDPPPKRPDPGRKPATRPRAGESVDGPSQGEAPAV